MALTYVGDPGRVYHSVTIGGQARSLEPVVGESYEIEDPGDGRWNAQGASKVAVADKGVVAPDTTKDGSDDATEAVEGNE